MSAIERAGDTPSQLSTVPESMSIPAMMQAVIGKEITPESVAVMKELVALKREMDADSARAEFNRDFLALRKECRPIAATRTVPTKDGGIKARFASLEDIVGEVSPLLEKYGFSDTYSQESIDNGRTRVTVTLLHTSGHERSSTYTCREHTSPQNTPAQNDGGTNKMARRHALCNMLGIVLDYSADARLEGDTITPEEAADLEQRVGLACGGDVAQMNRFLKLGGADRWENIRRAKYDVVVQHLEGIERRVPGVAPNAPPDAPKAPKAALLAAVKNWTRLPDAEIPAAINSIGAKMGLAKTGDKWSPEHCERMGAWVAARVKEGADFTEAVV